MAEPGGGFNRRSEPERVFHDLDPAGAVDERHVEAHVAVLPAGRSGKVFPGGGLKPGDLARPEPLRRHDMARSPLHFHEDETRRRGEDQVDLAPPATPAPRAKLGAKPDVARRDLILGGLSTVIGRCPAQSPPASCSALW